jgi:hypothetical protein
MRRRISRKFRRKIGADSTENGKEALTSRENDLVAIKRTQQEPRLKLTNKYHGSYKIIKVSRNNRYVVRKMGDHEGPWETSIAADYIKPWAS